MTSTQCGTSASPYGRQAESRCPALSCVMPCTADIRCAVLPCSGSNRRAESSRARDREHLTRVRSRYPRATGPRIVQAAPAQGWWRGHRGGEMGRITSRGAVARARGQLRRLCPEGRRVTGATDRARETLRLAGLDASTAPLRSLRVLRRADRRLSAVAARHLVELAAGRHPDAG